MSQAVVKNQESTRADVGFDVELRKVFKVYEGETAVRGIDLTIQRGEFFSILGPSGCGKTTTLRMIAGFESPTAGEVLIQGQIVNTVPPNRRPVNTVFQSYALFGHMTVWDNVAFGLRIQKAPRGEMMARVDEALKLVKMDGFAKRYPAQLSGGQQQRVALARALVNRPTVVLLDEPLGALDLKLRKEMQMELSNLHQKLGVTFVMVTHDQEEALSLSDRIAVMNEGRIEQIGSPQEIYERPKTPFVADFIGDTNLFKGRIFFLDRSTLQVQTESGLQIRVQPQQLWDTATKNQPVVISLRPEKVRLDFRRPEARENCFEGRLKNLMYMGTHVHYLVQLLSGDLITVMQPNQPQSILQESNAPIYVHWSPVDCLAIPVQ